MSPPHVFAVRLDDLGDVLLTGPAVRAMAASARRVISIADRSGRAAAELLRAVDDVGFDAPWGRSTPLVDGPSLDELLARAAALAVDEAFVFTCFHHSPLPMALLLGVAGVSRVSTTSVDFPGRLLDGPHVDIDGHDVEHPLLVATCEVGLPPDDAGPRRLAGRLPADPPFDSTYVVNHVGASESARRRIARSTIEVPA